MATIRNRTLRGQESDQTLSLTDGRTSDTLILTWHVETDSGLDQVVDCTAAFPVKRGMIYNVEDVTLPAMICTRVHAKKMTLSSDKPQTGSVFEVTVDYTGLQVQEEDPAEPYSATFSLATGSQTGQEPILYDIDGNRIENSAGDLFQDPVIAETETSNFTITRTEFVNPIAKQREYSDRYGIVNATPIWGYAARTLRLTITAQYAVDSGWTVSYNFLYKAETWDYRVVDRGFNYIDTMPNPDNSSQSVPVKKAILVSDTKSDGGDPIPVTEPVALDGSGKITTNENAAMLSYVRCDERDFHALNLPDIATV